MVPLGPLNRPMPPSGRTNPTTLAEVQRELILAQITLQELEDAREELLTKAASAERLQRETQAQADRALADFDHLDRVHRELLAHRDHLQHVLHVTNEALTATRTELQVREQELQGARAELAAVQAHAAELTVHLRGARDEIGRLENALRDQTAVGEQRATRIQQLDSELRHMKASRSWRWSAWLRSIERAMNRSGK